MRPAERLSQVRVSAIRRIAALRRDTSIDLGLGEPDLEPPGWMRDEAARIAREKSWRYSPNAGLGEVREAVAAYAGSRGAAEVCITTGAEEGLYAVMQALVDAEDEVLVPDPGFLAYPTLVALAGGTPVRYALDPMSWQIDFDALSAQLTDRTRMIVVNSPSNPAGSVVPESDIERLQEIAEERSLFVVFDEVYREIWYDAPPPVPDSPWVIRIGGMSKSHVMTGLRLGWVIASETILAPVIVAHQYIATCASVLSQHLAAAVLARGEENRVWLDEVRAHFRTRRDTALDAWEELVGTPVEPPAGAFYLFAPVPSCTTEAFALQLAGEDDVLVIPGSAFGPGGEGWLRISYAADQAAIRNGIERIAARLERQQR